MNMNEYATQTRLCVPRVPSLPSPGENGVQNTIADPVKEDRIGDARLLCGKGSEKFKFVAYKDPRTNAKRKTGRRRAYREDVLINDKNPRSEFKRDKSGLMQGAFQVFGANERVRSDSNAKSRSTTAVTRQHGACERCQKQKLRCNMSGNPFLSCGRCTNTSPQSLKTPCTRARILELNLHRRGSTLNSNLRNWILTQEQRFQLNLTQNGLASLETLDVVITQDQGIEIPVKVRRFKPESGDTTGWSWRDSNCQERVMEMPPFYICNVEEAAQNMRRAVVSEKAEYVNFFHGAANPIIRKTFEAAFRYLETSSSGLVSDCLTFWVATRLIERPWRICRGSLPGFEPLYDANEKQCPYNGIVPVTPIMDTQIDDMAIRYLLDPLGKRILRNLNSKIHERKKENWFEIYLATFIFMNNFEFIFSDVIDYTRRHGLKPSTTGAFSLSKAYYHACKTMLVYFRFACNGHAPLSLTWKNPAAPVDGLSIDQQEYLRDIKSDVDRQKKSLETWCTGSVYRTPLYLCYQVLAEDWSPDYSEVLDDFTEEDFLTS